MINAKAIVTLAVFFFQKPQQADSDKESCMYLLTKLSKVNRKVTHYKVNMNRTF